MAFLSLGLHNDEPSTSSDQGNNKSQRPNERARASSPPSLGLTSGARNFNSTAPNQAQPGEHQFRPVAPNANVVNGNGAVYSESGNGHPVARFDEFEADRFEDETDA